MNLWLFVGGALLAAVFSTGARVVFTQTRVSEWSYGRQRLVLYPLPVGTLVVTFHVALELPLVAAVAAALCSIGVNTLLDMRAARRSNEGAKV